MAWRRVIFAALILWSLDLFLLSQLPWVHWVVDPWLLFLIFLGFELPSPKFLWRYGILLGFLRDLVTGGLWGGFLCTFGLMGWLLGAIRNLFEREDYLVQGVWTGILTGFGGLVYGMILLVADPMVGWNRWVWGVIPISMGISGFIAGWGFPRLQRILKHQ